MPRVFIANSGAHDYSDAERYGELVFVTKGTIAKHGVGTMARAWALALKGSTEEDFIISSSLTTLCSLGTAIFARKHGCLNLLMFRNGKYVSRKVMLDQLLESEEA